MIAGLTLSGQYDGRAVCQCHAVLSEAVVKTSITIKEEGKGVQLPPATAQMVARRSSISSSTPSAALAVFLSNKINTRSPMQRPSDISLHSRNQLPKIAGSFLWAQAGQRSAAFHVDELSISCSEGDTNLKPIVCHPFSDVHLLSVRVAEAVCTLQSFDLGWV
jgi:hypothetical protein